MARRLAGCSIFVLEGDASTAYGLRTVLEAADAEVSFASDPGEALVRLDQADFHAAIIDGIECSDVRKALGGVPFLLYVARDRAGAVRDGGAAPLLVRPATATAIIDAVSKLLGKT